MAQVTSVRYHDAAEREITRSPEFRDRMQEIGDVIADDAAEHAPRRTGAGAASIEAVTELGPAGWEVRISWQKPNYYLKFHESGTVHMPARPFLVPALNRARGV